VTRVAVATTSAIAADAARQVAAAGGNAVDCALATALLSMNTEPGVCALAGGAYVTVWAPGHDPVTFDGNHAVPGRGLADEERGKGKVAVELDYGGGVTTIVGPGSVAVPGALAAVEKAWQRFGSLPWSELFAPTIHKARLDNWPAHYPWIDERGYRYFRKRLSEARRDVEHGLDITLDYYKTRADQERMLEVLQFKLDVLWTMLDCMWMAYIEKRPPYHNVGGKP